ncbi:MAG: aldo/keto reductase [Candidatus Thorarchaeota archaeon]
MKFRKLGRTSLEVSEIGLGTEYLTLQPTDVIIDTIQIALQSGMNYIDIVFTKPTFLQILNQIIACTREKVVLACPLGAGMKDGKHRKLRSKKAARASFEEVRKQLSTDYIDIAVIQFVAPSEYDKIMAPHGLIQYARELKETEVAKYLGMSTHHPPTALQAIESGEFALIMTHYNIFSENDPKRQKLLQACIENEVGFVAIKPFAGGLLLSSGKKVKIPAYKSGAGGKEVTIPSESSAIRYLAHILNQPAVSTVIPGVKNREELLTNLQYYDTPLEEQDYSFLIQFFSEI